MLYYTILYYIILYYIYIFMSMMIFDMLWIIRGILRDESSETSSGVF